LNTQTSIGLAGPRYGCRIARLRALAAQGGGTAPNAVAVDRRTRLILSPKQAVP
jgi:hypothetical protein